MHKEAKKTGFVDSAGRLIKRVGNVFFVNKASGKAYGNKAHKRADGRNIADHMTVPKAIRKLKK
jgi:hypothetical protein